MRTNFIFFVFLSAVSCLAQNLAVLTHGAANSEAFQRGCPSNAVYAAKDIGAATELPNGYSAPWVVMTQSQYDAHIASVESALELWDRVVNSRDLRKERVGEVLQQRIEAGQWEPNRLRLHALSAEMDAIMAQVIQLNSELLLLVVKAVGGTSATNNLTVAERARLTELRPQLIFAQATNLTQADRNRFGYIRDEFKKVINLWMDARALRNNIETNTTAVDPESLPGITIGE